VALEFRVVTGSNVPIYRQITDQVRKAVATSALSPGEQLPSVRALAELLVINPNTVARAYADLTHEGVLESQTGKGLFVAERRQKYSLAERLRRLDAALDALIHEVLFLDFQTEEIMARLRAKLSELEADVPFKK
jgi:GntR family transcriptional regulator